MRPIKEVIILGSGPTRTECDYHCETWGVNFVYTFAEKLDKLFFTDEVGEVEKHQYQKLDRLVQLKPTLVFPVIYPKFKNIELLIELYPITKIRKRFRNTKFFSDSIAYMLAYALYYSYKKIWMYGIDFYGLEKVQEQGGVEFWMGVALGMDVEIIVPELSDIGKTCWDNHRMYGEFGLREQ